MLVALAVAIPLSLLVGVVVALRPRLARVAVGSAGVVFTIPSLALFGALIGPLGLGAPPAVVALAAYSILPMLRNTVVGLGQVPDDVVDAATGMGLSAAQVLWRVRLRLALPVVVAGVRVAAVTGVGVATIASLVAAGGLGDSVFAGLRADDHAEVLAATVVVTALALAFDAALALAERALAGATRTPAGTAAVDGDGT